MERIVITGGSGFIGTNLLLSLSQKDDVELLNLDLVNSSVPKLDIITKICDIRDYERTKAFIKDFNPDYIIHLAARTDLNGENIDDYSSNTLGVENIVRIANELPDLKKILITSSMLVCKTGYMPKNQEDYCPTTLYGESKVLTEKITRAAELTCDWALLRPTSIWGPWFRVPYRNFFDMVRAKRYFHIGHKSCTKTYGYIGNAVYQIESILFSDTSKIHNKVFYLGDAQTNIEDWANEIAAQEGNRIIRMPYIIIKMAAVFGDVLRKFNIEFPMTSFRLNNMTTDNIVDLSNTDKIAPNRPYTRKEGINNTIRWLANESDTLYLSQI